MPIRQRLYAWLFHSFLSDHGNPDLDDPMTRDVRAPLLAGAHGAVLEIGAGDGANLPLYPSGVRLTLLDPNPYLLKHIPNVAHRLRRQVPFTVEGLAEQLPFPDHHFDTVVSTHVLCSVCGQLDVLTEIRRVLRPGGVFLFLEHVVAPPDTFTYRLQRLINPAWRLVGDGCHLTRDTGATIHAAGFQDVQLESFHAPYPSFVRPHIVGLAHTTHPSEGQTIQTSS